MDRSVKKYGVDDLKDLAKELIVHSDDFEVFASKGQNAIEALNSLSGLQELTELSLASFFPKPAEAIVVEPAPKPQPVTKAKGPDASLNQKVGATFTARGEYKSALKDPSLVEALLAFHQGAVVLEKRPAPTTPKATPVDFANQFQGFSQAAIPEIEATPKRDSQFKKLSRSTTPVLR